MKWTRREWALAIGAIPLHAAFDAQARGGGQSVVEHLPALGPPPPLPDKASFAHIKETSLDGASSHSRPLGANGYIKRALLTQMGDGDGFRPSQARIIQNYARLINADPSEIMLVPSTQIGESFVAAALGVHDKGSHVVSDHLHFVGSLQMYTDLSKRGVDVTWIRIRDNRIPVDELEKAISKQKTKLVAISATSFVTGFQHDVKRVCDIAHAKGAMVYADIIQAVGNEPIDVKAWGVDAACAATYKWLMSAGTAFLYVRRESLAAMRQPFYHYSRYTRLLPTTHMYPFDKPGVDIVDEYEPRTGVAGMFSMGYEPDIATLAGLEYSLPYIMNIGPDRIQTYRQPLIARLKEELPKKGYPLMTPIDSTSPIVTVAAENAVQKIGSALRTANVRATTRWNHLRISPSVFNDLEDIERLLAALPPA